MVYIEGEKFYLRKVKWPLCTGCWFFGKECPELMDCYSFGNYTHEYILIKNRNEKITYRFKSPLLTFRL